MKITFFFNYLNHHQVQVAEEMYRLLGNNFRFVATSPRNEKELKGGVDYSDQPYCILSGESDEANVLAQKLNIESDVCVYGAGHLEWMRQRAKTGKLSFEVSERWLKKGWRNILSPNLIKWWWLYQTTLKKKPFYKLCASAFASMDDEKLGCYRGRHYKWGYFTTVPQIDSSSRIQISSNRNSLQPGALDLESQTWSQHQETIKIMWCARFIDWKHPELPILLAEYLKKKGNKFQLDMYGDGSLREDLELKAENLGLKVCKAADSLNSKHSTLSYDIVFHGNVPNSQIHQAMRDSDIFLFTSDRNEGWGAVANEAMSEGCAIVGNVAIGSIPYLVEDGVNGLQYHNSIDSLIEKVEWLINHPQERLVMKEKAYLTMQTLWSPKKAAENLLQLINDIKAGKETSIKEGPCSKA